MPELFANSDLNKSPNIFLMENFLSALEGLIDVNLLREVSTYQYNEDRADGGGFGLAEAEAAAAGGGDGGVWPQV